MSPSVRFTNQSQTFKGGKVMAHKLMRQFLGALLALMLVIGLIPAAGLTALAAENTATALSEDSPFPEGAGTTKENPAVCDTFAEFKYAMENEHIPYVALGDCYEYLPAATGDTRLPGAISVRGFKNLYLTGNATFVAPAILDADYCDYDALLYNTYAYAALRIYGSGSLTYLASATDAKNAVISNVRGNVYVYGGILKGGYNAKTYGRAIWQDDFGELFVYNGVLMGECAAYDGASCDAVHLEGGKATVAGGSFYADNLSGNIHKKEYGLSIGADASADLWGGSFEGILLPTASTPLANYMDEDIYTPYADGYWFNPQSEYSQEYVESGKTVKIYRMVRKLDVHINAPYPGVTMNMDVYNVPVGCYKHMVQWYEDGEPVDGKLFQAGKSYKVMIYFLADDYGRFAAPLTSATVNYQTAQVATYGNDPTKDVYLTLDFGVCPDVIKKVALTIDAPKEHTTPDQSAVCGSTAYKQALAGDNMFDAPLQWMRSVDGKNYTTMKATDTFTAGNYYKVYIDVMPAKGYIFATDSNFETLVSATVNGYRATVNRYPEEDPEKLISACYDFGKLNDTVIEQIGITGVTEPVAGQKPNYTCGVLGSGYHLDKNYDDAYPGNVIQNGIGWWDYTGDQWVEPGEAFVAGHEYKVVVYVATDNGYAFYTSGKYDEPAGEGYINGNPATFGKQSLAQYGQSLSWVFAAAKAPALSVSGHINSTGRDSDPITLQLLPKGSSQAAYETEVKGNYVEYSFDEVLPGTYTLRVEKNGEIREFTVTVADAPVVQNVDFLLKGDFNEDGKVTDADAIYLLRHTLFPSSYLISQSGDFNGDSKTTDADAIYLLRHTLFPGSYPLN